jgi:hypothetical protein
VTIEFTPWPKTPRLFREAVITEKIDGTNAAVVVVAAETVSEEDYRPHMRAVLTPDDRAAYVVAQSRKRLITPEDDNFGFARWVHEHADGLALRLGLGVHFGEWWGSGIQRGYGLPRGERRFSLFHVARYADAVNPKAEDEDGAVLPDVPGLGVVPVLAQDVFSTDLVNGVLGSLRALGSRAAPGFMRPEGVVVFHSAARNVYKALLENDQAPKGCAA